MTSERLIYREDRLSAARRAFNEVAARCNWVNDVLEVDEAIAAIVDAVAAMPTESTTSPTTDPREQLKVDAVYLWERWAVFNYPQDLGDEGGWDQRMLEEWLADIRAAVLADGELPEEAR